MSTDSHNFAPTMGFWETSEQRRSRYEAVAGATAVVVENLANESQVYLSRDEGRSFELLKWRRTLSAYLKVNVHGLSWPPERISALKRVTTDSLTVLYVDPQWSEEDKYVYATYIFAKDVWRLKVE